MRNKGVLKFPAELERFNEELFAPTSRFEGDDIPVSQFPLGGEVPTGTAQLSKRGIAENVPHWHGNKCIQCGQCSFVCPHAVIRSYELSEDKEVARVPEGMELIKSRKQGYRFRIGVSALDCTSCAVCAETCPVKCLEMVPLEAEYAKTHQIIKFLREEVEPKPQLGDRKSVIGVSMQPPLFEFPGSCGGCGETPLVRLVSQLFGERMCIAAATGCNTIWGGSFPVVPYTKNRRGEGPSWHNSLFEDAAELGFGMISSYRHRRDLLIIHVAEVLAAPEGSVAGLTQELRAALEEWQRDKMDFEKSRVASDKLIPMIKAAAAGQGAVDPRLKEFATQHNLDLFPRSSFWIIGGDGWAYDIGFSGLDHVIANNEDINILVLDTEVYSNTGGQRSKATPLGAQAKFAIAGKETAKKDLGRIAMTYEKAYVASIAQGADMQHTITTLREAEAYPGPSIVIAYTPCTEHHLVRGMRDCMKVQKLAVETGYWILYRFNPLLAMQGKNPFSLDSKPPSKHPREYLATQGRFVSLEHEFPEHAK
jgi:pyruvate-ferredoxin/flavodoxin oxidoreductase